MKIVFTRSDKKLMKKRGMISLTEFLKRMYFSQYVYMIVALVVIFLPLIFFMDVSRDIIIDYTITDRWDAITRVIVWCASVIGFIELILIHWTRFVVSSRTIKFFDVPTHLKGKKKYEKKKSW